MARNQESWEKKLAAWQASGASGTSWCRKHKIAYHVFCYWKWKLRNRQKDLVKEKAFVELIDSEENGGSIEVEYQGVIVRLSRDFDANLFKRCLVALQELSC